MKKIKKYEELTIKDDFMFGIIMRNPKYCKTFLETVLDVKISRIEYPETQKTIDISLSSKSIRLDIYVEDGKNTVYNIEMQSALYKYIPKRSRYYQDMIDLNILEKGTADDVSEDMKALLNYIDGQLPSDDYTNELDAAVKSARLNENWRREYMTLEMHYQEKYEQGEAAGYKRGIEKGAEQTAISMLLEGDLSLDKIAKYTNLSIEQLKILQTKLSKVEFK